jgi:hypothetical protein
VVDNGGGGSHSMVKRPGNGEVEPELGVDAGRRQHSGVPFIGPRRRPGCEGEWWPSVGELKSTVMARGGI